MLRDCLIITLICVQDNRYYSSFSLQKHFTKLYVFKLMQIKLVMLASCSCCGIIGGLLTNFFEKMQDTVAHAA